MTAALEAARRTESFPPGTPLPPRARRPAGRVQVTDETTLTAARRLTNPVVLNFASARNPGGGFRIGASGQEEALCRATALYACLRDQAMYPFHRAEAGALNTDWMIYSPDVPVNDETWTCSVITCAAPNARAARMVGLPDAEVEHAMAQRIHRVLDLAAVKQHPSVVLGAWGCGAFGNDPVRVARLFCAALQAAPFDEVVFAISGERWTHHAFDQAFGDEPGPRE